MVAARFALAAASQPMLASALCFNTQLSGDGAVTTLPGEVDLFPSQRRADRERAAGTRSALFLEIDLVGHRRALTRASRAPMTRTRSLSSSPSRRSTIAGFKTHVTASALVAPLACARRRPTQPILLARFGFTPCVAPPITQLGEIAAVTTLPGVFPSQRRVDANMRRVRDQRRASSSILSVNAETHARFSRANDPHGIVVIVAESAMNYAGFKPPRDSVYVGCSAALGAGRPGRFCQRASDSPAARTTRHQIRETDAVITARARLICSRTASRR
jgi:hypothetical protein